MDRGLGKIKGGQLLPERIYFLQAVLLNTDFNQELSMTSLFLKSMLGALAVLLIAVLSKSKNFFIAGLIPLFPTFALIAHWIVGTERGVTDLRATALFGLWSLIPYAAYLLSVYLLSPNYSLVSTLVLSTIVWTISALLLLFIWSRFFPVSG